MDYDTGARPVVFRLSNAEFASTRFRIRLLEPRAFNGTGQRRCTHIRGLEVYGTILPPWSLD